jgi:hypothetical protein
MDTNEIPVQLDWSAVHPQERERYPLSGKVVNVRSHGGGNISFRGLEYKRGEDSIIRGVPIEAIEALEACTTWVNGQPAPIRFDVLGRDSELTK